MDNKSKAFLLALFLCVTLPISLHYVNDATVHKSAENFKETVQQLSETHEFQTEIGRLIEIFVRSHYPNKEVFLREVVSNASDALNKLRLLAVTDSSMLGQLPELIIKIAYNPEDKTLSIYDSGIGMTKQELINNLGTIVKPGTTNLAETLLKGQGLDLLDQFDIGFYSTFLVGNHVTVISKNNNDDQYIWESSGADSFAVKRDYGEDIKRGTKVVINLKEDAQEFFDEHKLRTLIQKYSELINFPIYLGFQKEVSREVTEEEASPVFEMNDAKKDFLENKVDNEEKKLKTKTITEKIWEWELVNDKKPIWLRNKQEITKKDYNNLYKELTQDDENPRAYIHFNADGEADFKSIMFIPSHAPSDFSGNNSISVSTLKLYVGGFLVNEKFEDLLPKYLSFIKGIVDTNDLPIHVSQESLQKLKSFKIMQKKLVRKVLEMIKKLADVNEEDDEEEEEYEDEDEDEDEIEDDAEPRENLASDNREEERQRKRQERISRYNDFWKEFGKYIKLGVIEDEANRNKLLQLTRWYTSRNTTELSSLDDYISRMKPGQDQCIYYIRDQSKEALLKDISFQRFLRAGYEIIFDDDSVSCLRHAYDYEKKLALDLTNVNYHNEQIANKIASKKLMKLNQLFAPLTKWWKNLLKDYSAEVTVSERLVEGTVTIVYPETGSSERGIKVIKASTQGPQNPYIDTKGELKINPGNPLIKILFERVQNNAGKETEEMAILLYETALINSDFKVSNPKQYSEKLFKLFNRTIDALNEDMDMPLSETNLIYSGLDVSNSREFTEKLFKFFNLVMGVPADAKVEHVEVEVELDEEDLFGPTDTGNRKQEYDL